MASPHPLNQAVIAQALHDLANGQLRHASSMGFTPRALEALKHPNLVSILVNSQVSWCSVKVNAEIVHRQLDRAHDLRRESETIDRMLRLGGSTEMVCEFFAYTHQEVALRRKCLKLPDRKGRWPVLSEAEETSLWERWRKEREVRKINVDDDAAMLALSMDLAEQSDLPLSVVWSAIREWIDQRMV
jgi:hypothetical protein